MYKKMILLIVLLIALNLSADESDDINKYGCLIVKIDNEKDYCIFIDKKFAGKQNERIKTSAGVHLLEIKLNDITVSNEKIMAYEKGVVEISKLKNEKNNKIYKYNVNKNTDIINIESGFYLFGIIFPLTNLLGYTYYGHEFARSYARPFYIMHVFSYFLPLVSYGIFYTAANIMLPVSSWHYKFDFDNIEYKIYFSASVVFFSLSYLINLIMGIFYIAYSDTYQDERFFTYKKIYFDINFAYNNLNIFVKLNI